MTNVTTTVWDGTKIEMTKEMILDYWNSEYPTDEGLCKDPAVQAVRQEVMLLSLATIHRLYEIMEEYNKGCAYFNEEGGNC